MANVNTKQGLKVTGDRNGAVSGFSVPSASTMGMSWDDNAATFLNTDTALNSQGASAHVQGNALDGTGVATGGVAATPYVVSYLSTLTAGQFNTFTVKRTAIHSTNAPTDSSASLMYGSDGFSFVKQATFAMAFTMKLSYT
jgi:hypothetical protein